MFESEKAAVDFSKQVTAHLWARQFLMAGLKQGQIKFYFHWSSALSVCITEMETDLRATCPEFCSLKQISEAGSLLFLKILKYCISMVL